VQINLTTLLAAGGHLVSGRAAVAGHCAAREGLSVIAMHGVASQAAAMQSSVRARTANGAFGGAGEAFGMPTEAKLYETKHPGYPPQVSGDHLH